jgi:ribonuclease VapC
VILDSSAIVAIVLREAGHAQLLDKLAVAPSAGVGIGAPTLAETGIVLTARLRRDARPLLLRLTQEFGLVIVPFGEAHWREAVDAFLRFGTGRHPAGLNFGDCMTYATARLARRPLLCTGSDFSKTDLPMA